MGWSISAHDVHNAWDKAVGRSTRHATHFAWTCKLRLSRRIEHGWQNDCVRFVGCHGASLGRRIKLSDHHTQRTSRAGRGLGFRSNRRSARFRLTQIPNQSNFDFAIYDSNKLLWGRGQNLSGQDEDLTLNLPAGRYYIMVTREFPLGEPDPDVFYKVKVEG